MIGPTHPDDQAAIDRLCDEFAAIREAAGVSQQSLAAALGVSKASVWYVERRRPANSRIDTLMRYSEPIGHKLVLEAEGLADIPATPAEQALIAGGFLGAAWLTKLRHIRVETGVSRKDVGAAMGVRWFTIAAVENNDAEPFISTVFRYTRALGGRLHARWEAL